MRARSRSCWVSSGHACGALLAAQQHVGVAGQLFKAEIGERAAEVLRGHFFKLVRLVEDDGGGFRQNAGVGRCRGQLADRSVGKKEVVVDDDDVGLESACAASR